MGPHDYETMLPDIIAELQALNQPDSNMLACKLNHCYASAMHHNKELKDLHFKKIQENFKLKAEIESLEKQIEKLQGN